MASTSHTTENVFLLSRLVFLMSCDIAAVRSRQLDSIILYPGVELAVCQQEGCLSPSHHSPEDRSFYIEEADLSEVPVDLGSLGTKSPLIVSSLVAVVSFAKLFAGVCITW